MFYVVYFCRTTLLTKHFTEVSIVKIWVLVSEPLSLILGPHHEGIHGPSYPRLPLASSAVTSTLCACVLLLHLLQPLAAVEQRGSPGFRQESRGVQAPSTDH